MATTRTKAAAPKRAPGRPTKYSPRMAEQAFKLALLGCADPEIADVLGISRATLNNWKADHPAFLDALTRGKTAADADVAKSLYERALGYSHKAVKHFFDGKTGTVVTAEYVEHYPPDTPAAALWLANRQRGRWSKTPGPDGGDEVMPERVKVTREDASIPDPSGA